MNQVGLSGGASYRCGGAGAASGGASGTATPRDRSGAAGLDLGMILGLIGEVLRVIAASLGSGRGCFTQTAASNTSAPTDRGPAADGSTFRLQGTRLRDVRIQSFTGALRRPGG